MPLTAKTLLQACVLLSMHQQQQKQYSPVVLKLTWDSACMQAPRDAFERFAAAMSAPATLRAGHALLRRFAAKREAACARTAPGATTDVTPLLKRLATRSPTKPNGQPPPPLERYPLRVFMCAFMILKHPEVVFSKQGDRESSLVATAKDMVAAFEVVLHRLVTPAASSISRQNSVGMSSEISGSTSSEEGRAVGELLSAWDAAWVPYLEQFVAWKCADAATLEVCRPLACTSAAAAHDT